MVVEQITTVSEYLVTSNLPVARCVPTGVENPVDNYQHPRLGMVDSRSVSPLAIDLQRASCEDLGTLRGHTNPISPATSVGSPHSTAPTSPDDSISDHHTEVHKTTRGLSGHDLFPSTPEYRKRLTA